MIPSIFTTEEIMMPEPTPPNVTDHQDTINWRKHTPLSAALHSFSLSAWDASLLPAIHWIYTQQPQVNSYKAALNTGNLRFFTGRAAIGLMATGCAFEAASDAIRSYNNPS